MMAKTPRGVSGYPIGNRDPGKRGRGGRKGCGTRAAMILVVTLAGTSAAVWLGWRLVEVLTG